MKKFISLTAMLLVLMGGIVSCSDNSIDSIIAEKERALVAARAVFLRVYDQVERAKAVRVNPSKTTTEIYYYRYRIVNGLLDEISALKAQQKALDAANSERTTTATTRAA